MEMKKKDADWEERYGAVAYEGETKGGIRLYVGTEFRAPEGKPMGDHPTIIIDMYHQCDRWEIINKLTDDVNKAYGELSDFIKELEEIQAFMLTPRFEEICKEVADGVDNSEV